MTYSIILRDPASGELGVAVQTAWPMVGAIVPWVAFGVGAVATQSFAEIAYGPRLLERLRAGEAPDAALAALLKGDPGAATRQVAVMNATGPNSDTHWLCLRGWRGACRGRRDHLPGEHDGADDGPCGDAPGSGRDHGAT
jgi:uncharacterized Ntn-hydrolase superfamily protein